MSVLVTGGCGYIGSHTVLRLLEQGEEVIVIDNLANSSANVIEKIKQISKKKDIYFYKIDIRDEQLLQKVFEQHDIQSVIHFAALKSIPDSFRDTEKYIQVNIEGTSNIIKMVKKYASKSLIFSSSASVYGVPDTLPIIEDEKLDPRNPYAETKIAGEKMSEQLFSDDSSKNIYVLRYFNPVGAHVSGLIGEDPKNGSTNLVPVISKVLKGELDALEIYGNDYETSDGTGVRDYIHITDLVDGHIAAMNHAKNVNGYFGIFNLGTGSGYSVFEIISEFEKLTDIIIPYEIKERRQGDVAECYADPQKANKILGWKAKYGLRKMCKDSWNWTNRVSQ